MSRITRVVQAAPVPLAGGAGLLAGGAGLLALMILLLFMSSRTGQAEFDEATRRLDAVEAYNARIDGAVLPLPLSYQIDFALLEQLQRKSRGAVGRFAALRRTTESRDLARLVERKAALLEDFKSNVAVLRNSRAIGREMIDELWTEPLVSKLGVERRLFSVDRSFLAYSSRPDEPDNETALRDALADLERAAPALAMSPAWPVLEQHAFRLIEHSVAARNLMQAIRILPISEAIERQNEQLQAQLAASERRASGFRTWLFIVAVLLLLFSATKVAQVRGYLRRIKGANRELDDGVRRRTLELSEANEALRLEIAERERVESQLLIAQKLESLGQLAAGVAHEINTPTQYVSDNVAFVAAAWRDVVSLVERGDGDRVDFEYLREEVPAALEQAAYGLQQISKIVAAMRDLSHPGGDSLQPADLNKAIESTALVARNEWKYRAELTLDLDASLPSVPCDVSAVNQVILNLIVNAAQAIAEARPPGELGHIAITTRRLAEHAEISVEDDGPGVPEEIKDRIFDPFFTTKDVGVGTGQGLSIAHRVIAGLHGGTLTLEPAVSGHGARFVIRLRLEIPEAEETKSGREEAPAAAAGF
jgi:signal transduction histidine kinase